MAPKRRKSQGQPSTENDPSFPVQSSESLPPKRQGKAVKRTSPPLSNISFNNFIYTLAFVAICIAAFYSWRLTVWKQQAGGWLNLALGRRPPVDHADAKMAPPMGGNKGAGGDDEVEAKISDLASALGIPPATLATAIASAVSAHVPPASLSSISEAAGATATLVQSMVKDEAADVTASAEGILNKMSGVVGLDDGGIDLD